MKNSSISLLAALLATGAIAAQPAAAPAPAAAAPAAPLPTRMQFCQQEVQGMAGDDRRAALKTCLVRRAEGERVVRSECQAQLRDVPTDPAGLRQLQRECEARALSVHSSDLPRPMAPIPAPAPAEPAPDGSAILRDGVAMPDDGVRIQGRGPASSEDRSVTPVTLPDGDQPEAATQP